jgi:hypothetical protein
MPLDRQLLQWLGDLRRLVVLSKADKLSRAEQAALQKEHPEALPRQRNEPVPGAAGPGAPEARAEAVAPKAWRPSAPTDRSRA